MHIVWLKFIILMVVSHFVSHLCCVINFIGLFSYNQLLVVSSSDEGLVCGVLACVIWTHTPHNSFFIPIAVTLHGLINMPLLHL